MITFGLVLGGIVLLIAGGDLLVRGAVVLARRIGVPPLFIGLTLVGFGTSTPELVTSVQAALAGSPGIAVGNIVGSNIANILLILAVAALIAPIPAAPRTLGRDGGAMLLTAFLFAALALTGRLDRFDAGVLLVLLVAYLVYAYRSERQVFGSDNGAETDPEESDGGRGPGTLIAAAMTLGGLLLVVLGGYWLVTGAIDLAQALGVSERVIGVTLVAIGTSLPELVTSVVAAWRRQPDIALGNVLGSNIYNILFIGGTTAFIQPLELPPAIVGFDLPVMLAASVLLVLFIWTGLRLSRWEGAVLLVGYVAYIRAVVS